MNCYILRQYHTNCHNTRWTVIQVVLDLYDGLIKKLLITHSRNYDGRITHSHLSVFWVRGNWLTFISGCSIPQSHNHIFQQTNKENAHWICQIRTYDDKIYLTAATCWTIIKTAQLFSDSVYNCNNLWSKFLAELWS